MTEPKEPVNLNQADRVFATNAEAVRAAIAELSAYYAEALRLTAAAIAQQYADAYAKAYAQAGVQAYHDELVKRGLKEMRRILDKQKRKP